MLSRNVIHSSICDMCLYYLSCSLSSWWVELCVRHGDNTRRKPSCLGETVLTAFAFLKNLQDKASWEQRLTTPKFSIYSKTFHIKMQNKQTPRKPFLSTRMEADNEKERMEHFTFHYFYFHYIHLLSLLFITVHLKERKRILCNIYNLKN